jgi:hypothetical protein
VRRAIDLAKSALGDQSLEAIAIIEDRTDSDLRGRGHIGSRCEPPPGRTKSRNYPILLRLRPGRLAADDPGEAHRPGVMAEPGERGAQAMDRQRGGEHAFDLQRPA